MAIYRNGNIRVRLFATAAGAPTFVYTGGALPVRAFTYEDRASRLPADRRWLRRGHESLGSLPRVHLARVQVSLRVESDVVYPVERARGSTRVAGGGDDRARVARSEERRVGKEWGCGRSGVADKK